MQNPVLDALLKTANSTPSGFDTSAPFSFPVPKPATPAATTTKAPLNLQTDPTKITSTIRSNVAVGVPDTTAPTKSVVDLLNDTQFVDQMRHVPIDLAQSTIRGAANLAQLAYSPVGVLLGAQNDISSEVTPNSWTAPVFGTDKPFSFTSETAPFLDMFGIKPGSKTSNVVSPVLGFLGSLYLPESRVIRGLTAAKTAEEASTILKTAGFTDEAIAKYAPRFASASDEKSVSTLLNELKASSKTTEQTASQAQKGLSQEGRQLDNTQVPPRTSPPQSGKVFSSTPTVLDGFDPVKYANEQAALQEAARGTKVSTTLRSFLDEAKAKFVDFTAPIEDTLARAVRESNISLKPSEDIHNQIDRVLRAPTLAGQFAKDNGIVDVIRNVDNIHEFDQFLIARHAIELEAQGIKTGRNIVKDQALLDAFEKKYGPYADAISAYSDRLLQYITQAGLISQKVADALRAKYPHYVPFNRVFSELEAGKPFSSPKAVASLSKQNVVQKIVGSERQVESPIQSLLAKTNDAFTQGEKNIAGRILAKYKDLPGNPFQLRELKPGEHAAHTISFLDNGVKRTFETTKEIAEAAKSLNVQQLGVVGRILAFPTRLAKLGITGINLPFVASNIVKDQMTAFINSDKALQTSIVNPVNFIRSLFSAVGHDGLYEEMIRAAGGGTSFDIARNQVAPTVEKIRAGRNVGSRILYTATHPGELLRAVENIVGRSEEMTRIQQFRGTKKSLLNKGFSAEEAAIGAGRAARDNTVNFARRGEWGPVLNAAFLYINAGIQGTRTLLRGLKERPLATASKIALAGMVPVAYATAWNLSDPKRKAAYDDIPDYEKQGNIIIIPPNPTQDKNGNWNVIKIPLSQEVNNLLNIVRREMEAAHGLDPVRFGEFAQAFLGTFSPINPTAGSLASTLTPQIIKPSLEGYLNKNFFTGLPTVPDSKKNLPPEMQVRDNTSGTARIIGNKLGISPLKVEAWIKETFGGVGSQALNAVDQALASKGVIPKSQVGGQNILDAITARFTSARGGAVESKQYDRYNQFNSEAAVQSAQAKEQVKAEIDHIKSLGSNEEKKAYLLGIAQKDPEMAKKILATAKEESLQRSQFESSLSNAPVSTRAKYINEELSKLGTNEEKKALLLDYAKKKILTESVLKELGTMKKKQGATSTPATSKPTSLLQKVGNDALSALGVETASAAEMPTGEKKQVTDATSTVYSQADKIAPQIHPAFIKALVDQESSNGTNDKNRALDQGKYGWLVGFTKSTYQDILQKSKTSQKYRNLMAAIPGFDTPEDAMKSALIYAQFRLRDHTKEQQTGNREYKNISATDLYWLYNGGASPGGVKSFDQKFNSYLQ